MYYIRMLHLLNLLTFSYSHLLIFPCARMFIFPFPQILGNPGHVLGRNQGRNLKFSIAFHPAGSGDHIPKDTARHGRSHSPHGHGAPQTQPFPPRTRRATDAKDIFPAQRTHASEAQISTDS